MKNCPIDVVICIKIVCLAREETVAKLLSNMFESDKNESVLVNGLCVIHTLLEVRRQG